MAIIKTVNAEGGSDARYDVSQMTPDERRNFDSGGRPLGVGFPDQDVWTPGLPGARGGDSQYSMGGGGSASGNPADAFTRQLQSLLQSQSIAERADTRGAIQQALISYGVVPQGFKDEFGALDDTTRALIQKNMDTGIAGYARMQDAHQDRERSMLADLSSRGLRRSGAKGYLGRRNQLDWDRQSADASAALLQSVGGMQKGFANSEMQRKMQLLQALFNQQPSPSQTYQQSAVANKPPALQYWDSKAGPSPYKPVQDGTYTGGALYATQSENEKINPIFWFK
jgi:hypothetical protein